MDQRVGKWIAVPIRVKNKTKKTNKKNKQTEKKKNKQRLVHPKGLILIHQRIQKQVKLKTKQNKTKQNKTKQKQNKQKTKN